MDECERVHQRADDASISEGHACVLCPDTPHLHLRRGVAPPLGRNGCGDRPLLGSELLGEGKKGGGERKDGEGVYERE